MDERCKDCEYILGLKEDLARHEEQIKSNTKDISELKEDRKETKLYIKMIFEKLDILTSGFEELNRDRKKEKEDKIKKLEQKKKDKNFAEKILADSYPLILKIVILLILIISGFKVATIDITKLFSVLF